MSVLDIVPVYASGDRSLIARLARELEVVLRLRPRLREPWFDPEIAFDASRGQFNSTVLLRLLLDDPEDSSNRVLGVAGVDLFAPVLTYVFGEAQLGGRAAVVSLHRLRPEAYGLPAAPALLFERLLKEAVHELGPTYGLVHCLNPRCVMQSSTYVEEIDFKPVDLCEACLGACRLPALPDARGS